VRRILEATLQAKVTGWSGSGPFAAFAPAVEALTPGSIDVTVGTVSVSAMGRMTRHLRTQWLV
jgi:hypothetical protein